MFQMPERSCASKFAAGAAGCLAAGDCNGFAVGRGGMAPALGAGRVCARPAQVNAKARAKIGMESFRWAGIVMVRFLSPSIISERSHSANAVFRCQKAPAFALCAKAGLQRMPARCRRYKSPSARDFFGGNSGGI